MSESEQWARHRALNEHIIRQFELAGDDPTRPRLVAHSALVTSEVCVQRAADALRALDFHVELAAEDGKRVLFSRMDKLTREDVEAFTGAILSVVAASQGVYEGWAAAMLTR